MTVKNESENIVELTSINGVWSWTSAWPLNPYSNGPHIMGILFKPGGADDILVVKHGSVTGPQIMAVKCAAVTDEKYVRFDRSLKPVIDYDNCSLSAGHVVTIIAKP